MPFKDKERSRRYNREYARLRRAGQPGAGAVVQVLQASSPEQTSTASGLLHILGGLISDVIKSPQGDPFIKARTVAFVVSVALRAIETADLEARLTNLENKVWGGKQ